MGAVVSKVSSFGPVGTTFYTLLRFLKMNDGENLNVCEVGCLDGKYTIPLLKRGYNVDAYEMNNIYLYGGHVQYPVVREDESVILQKRTIYGAEDRINIEELHDNVNLYNENFFLYNNKQYDFVFTIRSLNRDEYADISMDKKIKALQDAVKEDGVLYIEYLMWLDDKNEEGLNNDQYIKQCEMKKYFDNNWEIITLVEDRNHIIEEPHIGNPVFHKHRVGAIKARKKKNFEKKYFNVNTFFN